MRANAPQREAESTATDERLVQKILEGDSLLFEVLMRRYNQRMYRIALAILRDDAEAEDAMQQAYLSAFTHLSQFREATKFSAWLGRIVVNKASTLLRKQAKTRLSLLEEEKPESKAPSPEEHAVGRQLTSIIEAAILELPEMYRVVFMMRAVEEMSTEETARCLSISEETAKIRLHRARARLRELIEKKIGESLSSSFSFHRARCDRVVARVFDALATLGLTGSRLYKA